MKIRFADKFVADLDTGELFRHGRVRRLQDKPFRLLQLLLARPQRLVRYDEIEHQLWPHINVEARHGIKEAARKVRQALGGDAYLLQCLRGRGYRLMLSDLTFIAETDHDAALTQFAPGANPSQTSPPPYPLAESASAGVPGG
jgi:DNA-binding winged helix-turn-helix (wHTH) protein